MDRDKDGQQKKAKLIISLVKHENFQQNIEKFEKIKAENDHALGARKAAKIIEKETQWDPSSLDIASEWAMSQLKR